MKHSRAEKLLLEMFDELSEEKRIELAEDYGYGYEDGRYDEDDRIPMLLEALVDGDYYLDRLNQFQFITRDGGGEGGAEDCYSVFKWKGTYYRMDYRYYSYDGFHMDDAIETLREVTPREKTITVYE